MMSCREILMARAAWLSMPVIACMALPAAGAGEAAPTFEPAWSMGGFIALVSTGSTALDRPWPLVAGEFGLGWQLAPALSIESNLALEDGEPVPATLRASWQASSWLRLDGGLQDLPFARDRDWFAAPDRPCIHAPLTTDEGLEGGLGEHSLVVEFSLPATVHLESWLSHPLFAEDGLGVGSRLSLQQENRELGLSLHREAHVKLDLLALDFRLGSFNAEGLLRQRTGRTDAWGWHLEQPWTLQERRVGQTLLHTGVEQWLPADAPGVRAIRLALSQELGAGFMLRLEERRQWSAGEQGLEHGLQLIVIL
ncbi:MAG: hypothetical protein KDC10_07710 [Calditrichaeota bacterium]|nr:hypothetical protein [Calditrichota bacterium]